MTEGMEDSSSGPAPPPGSVSPAGSTVDTGRVPEEKPEATEAAGRESGEEEEGGAAGDGEHLGALGIAALPGTCCVCIEMDQMNGCLHSEKICILPLLACLLSLALCTAGLKWVFVDKIFQYDPPTHLDPKRIGQDPILISVTPTLGLAMSTPQYPALSSLSTASTPGGPGVLAEERSTPPRPSTPEPPRGTRAGPSVTLKYSAGPEQTPPPRSERPLNDIIVPTIGEYPTQRAALASERFTRLVCFVTGFVRRASEERGSRKRVRTQLKETRCDLQSAAWRPERREEAPLTPRSASVSCSQNSRGSIHREERVRKKKRKKNQ